MWPGIALHRNFVTWGEPILWQQNIGRCPCYNPSTGTWNLNHVQCNGTGRLLVSIDLTQPPAANYRVLVTNVTVGKIYEPLGQFQAGELILSFWPNEFAIGEGDLIVIPSRQTTYSEELIHSSTGDTLSQSNVYTIDAIWGLNGAFNGWNLNGNTITWSSGGPSIGDYYTVRYQYSPTYQVIAASFLRRRPDNPLNVFSYQTVPSRAALKIWNPNLMDTGG